MKKLQQSTVYTVIHTLVKRYFEDGVARASAELAYYLFFSLFPMLIFLNAILSTLNLSAEEIIRGFDLVLPQEIVGVLTDYIAYLEQTDARAMMVGGLFATIYMIARVLRSLMRSVARAYRIERTSFISALISYGITILLLLSIFVLLVAQVLSGNLLEKAGQYISLSDQFLTLWSILSYAIVPAFVFVLVALFYKLVSGRGYSFRWALPGSGFFMVVWLVATGGFSYYVSNMGRYSLLYGSLGAIMILMLWLYLTGNVLILGGELNCVLADALGKNSREKGEKP